MPLIRLPIGAIRLDEATQIRLFSDDALIDEYAAAYRHEEDLPPPDVFGPLEDDVLPPGAEVWIGDGHTRARAALRADLAFLTCNVHPGGEEEAFAFALTANRRHGARLTTADKRNAVRKALLRWSGESNREIARRCGVDDKTVVPVRKALESTAEIPQLAERKGADGKARAAKKEPVPTAPPAEPRGYTEALFGGAPDTGEPAEGPPPRIEPERTAGDGDETIIIDGEEEPHGEAEEAEEALPAVREEAQAAVGGSEGVRPEDEQAGPPAAVPGELLREARPAGDEAPQLQADESGTDIADRIRFLRLSPISKGCPESDRPSFAAALREWADSLAPLPLGFWQARGELAEERAAAAEARAREMEAQACPSCLELDETRGALEAARKELAISDETLATLQATYERAEARVRELAAESERRYDCHAGPGTTEPACGACISCLTNVIATQETELASLRGYAAAEIDADARREAREERRRTFAAALGAPEIAPAAVGDTAPEQPTGDHPPAQAELTYEPDPDLQRRPPKKAAKGKAPKPTLALPVKWHVGDQTLTDTKDGVRRCVVVFKRPDGGLHIVLRADKTRALKASAVPATISPDKLRQDPAHSAEDRRRALREAIDLLGGMTNPPETWIAACREAGKVA